MQTPKRGSAKARDKYLVRIGNKWRAHFYRDGTVYYLGLFDSKKMARGARDAATESGLAPYAAVVYVKGLFPQKTQIPGAEPKEDSNYRPLAKSRVLLSDAIINAKTSELNLMRTRFRTIELGQIFYCDSHWYVKRSNNNAVRADTHQRHPAKYFSATNMIRVLRDPQQPLHAPPVPPPAAPVSPVAPPGRPLHPPPVPAPPR